MTRVALYGRFSTEGQRDASIEDQFRNCEQYAARQQGWTVTARYQDKAISGATDERPGYQRMLKDAEAHSFDVLLIDDFSRLSRDQVEVEKTRRRFVFWKVRLVGVSDGIDTHQKGHKLLSSVKGIMNDIFLDDLRDKTCRGMIGQALKGFHLGGKVYGYRLVPQTDATRTDPYGKPARIGTRLQVDSEEGRWVRWIFEHYAEGWSPLKIVEELNRREVPPPGAAYRGSTTWAANALHGDTNRGTGLLANNLYRGLYVWNRTKYEKHPDTKKTTRILRDKSEWIIKSDPDLRIVSDELWERVEARLQEVHQASAKIRAILHAKARTGRQPKYLFSGLLTCGQCGGKYVICEPTRYGCSSWLYRGLSVCDNTIKVSRQLVESLLLESIQRDLFTKEGLAEFKKQTARLLAERRRATSSNLAHAQTRLKQVEQEVARMVRAIKDGVRSDTLRADLEQAEVERVRLLEMLHVQPKKLDKVVSFLPNAVGRFKALVTDLADTCARYDVDKARSILRELLGKQILLHPTANGSERYLTAELSGDYGGLIRLIFGENKFGGGQGDRTPDLVVANDALSQLS